MTCIFIYTNVKKSDSKTLTFGQETRLLHLRNFTVNSTPDTTTSFFFNSSNHQAHIFG